MKKWMTWWWLMVSASVASGHTTYESELKLDFTGGQIRAELQVPRERLEQALNERIDSDVLQGEELTGYFARGLKARVPQGAEYRVRLASELTIALVNDAPYVVAQYRLNPPAGYEANRVELEDNVLLDHLPAQVALVSVQSDWRNGVFANEPELVGVLRSSSRSLVVDQTGGSWTRGFASVFRMGMRHIAEGTDHLLFLLALLIPAPLIAASSYWVGYAGVKRTLLRIGGVVTAFTLGHSLTLAIAALGLVRVPSQPVEVLIALSILVSAIHAYRPLFPGKEASVACSFGLIHGVAFATTLGELGLRGWEKLASILSFNLGIEAMQLVVVAAALPSLLLLSRTQIYKPVRTGAAALTGAIAMGWSVERILEIQTPLDTLVSRMAAQAVPIAAVLLIASLLCFFPDLKRRSEVRG